ncbi:hypothetical protein BDZ89DRAFT_1125994 [Hymenopellis radicata]|nr:hypothetical protein BDZ89DRAFT_1125994 [Hymenopellis radicata]
MARKTAPNSRNQPEKEDEFHFSSQGSDDHMLQQALAERVLAAKDKKKKETEKKFLAAAHKHLTKDTSEASDQLEALYQAAHDEYQKFIISYASVDDEIRSLWEAIRAEYNNLAALAQKRGKINVVSGQSCEAAHIKAIGKVREACIETERIVNIVNPDKTEES